MLPIEILKRGRGTPPGGGGGGLDTQTVTTGTSGSIPNRFRGFSTSLAIGNIVDGTSNIYAGAAITEFYWDENGGGGTEQVILKITGATNTGWTQVTINGTVFTRAAATFGSNTWTWLGIVTNPFGATTSNVTCVFT